MQKKRNINPNQSIISIIIIMIKGKEVRFSCAKSHNKEEEESDGPACVHTYIASEVPLSLGDSELAGKAWRSGEGVAASVLAASEQNIPAVWPFPSLAPPTRCSHES